MKHVEDLMIYKQYIELIYYTEMILKKFPKSERFALVTTIKNTTYEGLKCILLSYRSYEKSEKVKTLLELDVDLKLLKAYIRVCHKMKYITSRNYTAWSKKLTNIGNLLGGWIRTCQKQ